MCWFLDADNDETLRTLKLAGVQESARIEKGRQNRSDLVLYHYCGARRILMLAVQSSLAAGGAISSHCAGTSPHLRASIW
jgi:hypothetical protein